MREAACVGVGDGRRRLGMQCGRGGGEREEGNKE